MKWNVYVEDINKNEIEIFNVFDHWRFKEEVEKHLKKYKNKEEFAESLKHSTMYYFWCKAEWEIVITEWVPHITNEELDRINKDSKEFELKYGKTPYCHYINPKNGIKIDVYDQLKLNWDSFVDYVWNTKIHRPRKKYGYWEYNPDGNDWGIGAWVCSECGAKNDNLGCDEHPHLSPYLFSGAQFCPHCGLPMKPKN